MRQIKLNPLLPVQRAGWWDCGTLIMSSLGRLTSGFSASTSKRVESTCSFRKPACTVRGEVQIGLERRKALKREVLGRKPFPKAPSASDAPKEAANLGMFRPPLVYGAAIITGLLLEFGWPLPFLPRLLAALLGSFLVVVAVVVFAY